MIYFTGDVHCPKDIGKLAKSNCDLTGATKDDYVIVCGDMGITWGYDKEADAYWQSWLENKPFTTLFVDGNHENFDILNSYPVETWNGGKIHRIQPTVLHLMRGQVFTINDTRIFTMGGATSQDRLWRREHISWWAEELPSDEEYAEALKNLDANNWEVDYVVTHCLPFKVQQIFNETFEKDKLVQFLDTVEDTLKYKHWYCGHYHENVHLTDKVTCLYNHVLDINNNIVYDKYGCGIADFTKDN